jgi:hypothetical protein
VIAAMESYLSTWAPGSRSCRGHLRVCVLAFRRGIVGSGERGCAVAAQIASRPKWGLTSANDADSGPIAANYAALTPVSFLARAAEVYPGKAAVIQR